MGWYCGRPVHTIGGGELTIPYTNTDLSKKQKLPMEPCIHDSIGGWSEWRDSFASATKGADRGSPRSSPRRIELFEFRSIQKSPDSAKADSGLLVRVARLELAASCSQSRRATSCATPGYHGIIHEKNGKCNRNLSFPGNKKAAAKLRQPWFVDQ